MSNVVKVLREVGQRLSKGEAHVKLELGQGDLVELAHLLHVYDAAGPISIAPTASDLYRDLRHKAPQGHQSDTDHGG